MPVTVRSFAKINLGLRIGALREDGFHQLLTVYQTIGLHDLLRVRVERGSGIEIRCTDSRVPKDESNTCFPIIEKAMPILRAKGRVVVEIEKRLPVQGGLGGPSSNAVAALLGLERVLKKSLDAKERLRIAAEVGSDLPLFLLGGTALGLGRGEEVYPLEDLPTTPCVVVTPEVGVSTPKAFAEWDRLCARGTSARGTTSVDETHKSHRSAGLRPFSASGASSSGTAEAAVATWPGTFSDEPKLTSAGASDRMNGLSCALSAWLSLPYSGAPSKRGRAENPLLELVRAGIENDFEQVVFPEYPELREGKRALERAGAKYASLSGSGSALYGLFGSPAAAAKAATGLQKQGWAAQATVTVPRRTYWKKFLASSF